MDFYWTTRPYIPDYSTRLCAGCSVTQEIAKFKTSSGSSRKNLFLLLSVRSVTLVNNWCLSLPRSILPPNSASLNFSCRKIHKKLKCNRLSCSCLWACPYDNAGYWYTFMIFSMNVIYSYIHITYTFMLFFCKLWPLISSIIIMSFRYYFSVMWSFMWIGQQSVRH
jgi:hypothetical protein